jgi:hypothetical protein
MTATLTADTEPEFYLGTHRPYWLRETDIPLCISYSTLAAYSPTRTGNLPQARGRWILDSRGFSELTKYGEWTIGPDTYGQDVYRLIEGVGMPDFAAPQDWMCEPQILAKTGLDVAAHQRRTIENYLYLTSAYPDAPWIPVLQGWTLEDYHRCADLYAEAGVDLAAASTVGLGSVCRRQSTEEIGAIVSSLAGRGYRLHGFGVKTAGLERYGRYLHKADSMAWSTGARIRKIKLFGCEHRGNCANCLTYALAWRDRVLAVMRAGLLRHHVRTMTLFDLPMTEPVA